VTLGAPSGGPTVEEVLEVLGDPATSAVVDLVGLPLSARPDFFEALLPRIHDLQTRFGRPHWIIVDEAHHLMPATWESTPSPFPDELGAALLVVLDPARLSRAALESVDDVIAVGDEPWETLEPFAEATNRGQAPRRERLPKGASATIWRLNEGPGGTTFVKVRPPRFEQERHRRKYAEGELSADRSFYFRGTDGRLNLRAQNLEMFVQIADGVDDETWLHHLRNGEYSSWIRRVVKDDELADAVARIEASPDIQPRDSRQRIREAIEARYTAPV
jgi:hypothetical protein